MPVDIGGRRRVGAPPRHRRSALLPADAAGAIGWAKGFAAGAHSFETPDPATKAALTRLPALALWGEADRTLHAEHFLPLFRQAFPDGDVRRLPGVGHYSPEDAADDVARLVTDFVTAR